MSIENPYRMIVEDQILREDPIELQRIADLAYAVHDEIWGGEYTDNEISGEIGELIEAAEQGLGVFIGLSYSDTESGSVNNVLSFLLAYELPTDEASLSEDPDIVEGLADYGLTPTSVQNILRGRRVLYVANYSRLPTEEAKQENAEMFKAVLSFAMVEDFVITARCRVATSYKVLKRYAERGYINFLLDIDDGDGYHQVVIEINNKSKLLRIARKFVIWGRVIREMGKNYIFRGLTGLKRRLR